MTTKPQPIVGHAAMHFNPYPDFYTDGPPFAAHLEPRRLLPPKKVVKRARNRKAKKK